MNALKGERRFDDRWNILRVQVLERSVRSAKGFIELRLRDQCRHMVLIVGKTVTVLFLEHTLEPPYILLGPR
jgi:hypothetical protein